MQKYMETNNGSPDSAASVNSQYHLLETDRPIPVENSDAIGKSFGEFEPISLDRTNILAKMLSRVDNKYVLNFDEFSSFLEVVKNDFAVLEIEKMRQFTYHSCYYDDAFKCYFEHLQGRRQRFKVRTRKYVDGGGMQFFEVKLKGVRGLTTKHRIKSSFLVTPEINGECLGMLQDIYTKQYKKRMALELTPALMVGYKRCTLVALQGGERVTVDYLLSFAEPQKTKAPVQVGTGFIIVETKSSKGRGIADTAMRKLKIQKASNCSKYCVGVNLINAVKKNNKFLETIKLVQRNIIDNFNEDLLPQVET